MYIRSDAFVHLYETLGQLPLSEDLNNTLFKNKYIP